MHEKIQKYLKRYGLKYVISLAVERLIRIFNLYTSIELVKIKVATDSHELFKGEVAYGPFRGLKVPHETWWGKYDALAKYTGQYEEHVLREIINLSENHTHFIDIGAADGYYAVGVVKKNIFATATAFEISEKGRAVIGMSAESNQVADKVNIKGEANGEEIIADVKIHGPSLILCDIEGGEFTLFTDENMRAIRECSILIELHSDFPNTSKGSRNRLLKNAAKYFYIEYLERSNPRAHHFPEMNDWTDDFRMLAMSESRPSKMEWILLRPKNSRL